MNVLTFDDHAAAIPLLQEVVDKISSKIIMSTIDSAKTACQIAMENTLPLSSTYKKIRKLQAMGILYIEKIDLDGSGKKVVLYRSKIKSLEFNLKRDRISLQMEKNDVAAIIRIENQELT